MNYRLAELSDIPRLVELRTQQIIDEGLHPPDEDVTGEIADYFSSGMSDGSFICWLATDDENRIIATAGVCLYHLPPSNSTLTGLNAHIANMFTLEEYRRRGIASHLLGLVIGEAVSRGYTIIRLHTSPDGEQLYRKAGFVDTQGDMLLRLF